MKTTASSSKQTSNHHRLASGISGLVLGTVAACMALAPLPGGQVAYAAGESMSDFFATPVDSAFSAPPLAMLTLSNDQQLYYKAYDDYSDLNGDGAVDLTYNHDIDYYGYFDYTKCYSYNNGSGYFVPEAETTDKYCDSVAGDWSGNFVNWATMHRMDIVRKVLYGGKRYSDASNQTVLERVFLPNDAHSSAKYYNGPDIARLTPFDPPHAGSSSPPPAEDQGITICNTTHVGNPGSNFYSQDVDTDVYPPLMRVAQGNFSLWNAAERWQCRWSEERTTTNANVAVLSGIPAHSDPPSNSADGLSISGGAGPDFNVRVQACVDGLIGTENCREYPGSGTPIRKPAGLLQDFGGDNSIAFGLVTGSYEKNLSGGVLRKNVVSIDDEISQTTGQFLNTDGIIKTLNTFRIYGYNFRTGHYLDTLLAGGDQCTFGLSDFPEGRCSNWGNPQTEIFLEGIRYLSGKSGNIDAYQADDDTYISGLTTASWDNSDLITNDNACASLNIISFNASYASKDSGPLPDMDSAATSQTNIIGVEEGIQGNDFFIGENGTDNNQLCTAKTVNNFADVAGLCPEAPRVGGSYKISGLAYDTHINDQHSGVDGTQVIDTYGVTLSPSTPRIIVNVPNSNSVVGLLPACINYNPITQFGAPQGSCTLVDFKVVSQTATSGMFYVNWEDSEAGGDFDQDMWGTIDYSVDTATNKITVTTDVHAKSTPHTMGFGYVIAGTVGQDGFHAHSGINNFKYPNRIGPDGVAQTDATGVPGCPNAENPDFCGAPASVVGFGPDLDAPPPAGMPIPPTSHTYTIGNEIAGILELPLFYAAKWGSFDDKNGNDLPDLQEEWDEKNNFDPTDNTPDGLPDKYFLVSNPTQLVNSVTRVFEDLLSKSPATGAAAAVISSSALGFGAVIQAQYQPEFQDDDFNKVRWIGDIKAVFIDDFGLLREDSDQDGILDGYTTDKVIEFEYDPVSETTKLIRFNSSDDDVFVKSGQTEAFLNTFKPIWSAADNLRALTNVTTQRIYSSNASTGRHILTWMPSSAPSDGKVSDQNQIVDFTASSVTATNFGYFGVNSQAAAQNIVNFTRGDDTIAGFRNRSAYFDGDSETTTKTTWRLSDIVHGPPLAVGPPRDNFDIIQGDPDYAIYKEQYKNRRLVVISGGNGGLIQAFNGGFYDEITREYKEGSPNHPLGSELWAYAPMNLLPHLQWLADPNYSHVYYVDGKPQAFDAKIFDDDADHPGGWGTVLVVGMRLGGGAFEVDHDQDPATAPLTLRSAYVVMDITNPETKPKVLAEISHAELGFTTSTPDIIFRYDENLGKNTWFLAFGSGPTDLSNFTSNQSARLFNYNLKAKQMRNGWPVDLADAFTTPDDLAFIANSFVGDVTGADFDIFQAGDDFFADPKYRTDAWYFGVTSGDPDAPTGKLFRWKRINGAADPDNSLKLLLDPGDAADAGDRRPNQAFMNAPTLSRDDNNRIWVYAGTGRYEAKDDKLSDHQQSFYGIKEPVNGSGAISYAEVSRDDVLDVTDIRVKADDDNDGDSVIKLKSGSPVVLGGETIETFKELETYIEDNKAGWLHELMEAGGGDPSTRNVSRAAVTGGVLAYADFTPSAELCEPLGESAVNIVYYKTGTGHPGVLAPDLVTEEEEAAATGGTRTETQKGRAMEPGFHEGTGGGESVVTLRWPGSTLETTAEEINLAGEPGERTSWHEILINE
jgi:type IV pilus assembly protein PilY1